MSQQFERDNTLRFTFLKRNKTKQLNYLSELFCSLVDALCCIFCACVCVCVCLKKLNSLFRLSINIHICQYQVHATFIRNSISFHHIIQWSKLIFFQIASTIDKMSKKKKYYNISCTCFWCPFKWINAKSKCEIRGKFSLTFATKIAHTHSTFFVLFVFKT